MRRSVDGAFRLPADVQFTRVNGDVLVKIRDAHKIASIHPVALEMAEELLTGVGSVGAAFELATSEFLASAGPIEKRLKRDLKRAAKQLDTAHTYRVKSVRDGDRLVFWLTA